MAPNNALRTAQAKTSTSVLSSSAIEDRGIGTDDPVERDIGAFLADGRLSLRGELHAFFTLFTFFTRLQGPSWTDHHPGFLMRGMAYAPLANVRAHVEKRVLMTSGDLHEHWL